MLTTPEAHIISAKKDEGEAGSRITVGADPREQLVLEWLQKRADSTTCVLGLLQTYDAHPLLPGLELRHDTYDNAVAAILFDLHSDTKRAEQILDGFIKKIDAQNSDAKQLLWPSYNADGSPTDDWRQDAGNNAWAIIALAFHGSKIAGVDPKYMTKALELKDKLKKELAFTEPGSFDPSKPHSVNVQDDTQNSSTEHSTDLVSVGRLGNDASLLETCQKFVGAMWVADYGTKKSGAYMTGTQNDGSINYSPCPIDCQTWTLLAEADPDAQAQDRDRGAMKIVRDEFFQTETYGGTSYSGVLFSISGSQSGIQMENTASSSMAIAKFMREDKRSDASTDLSSQLNAMVDTLQQLSSKNAGAVLACVNPAGISQGFGPQITYAPTPHLGSTAWTGLLFGYIRNNGCNPEFNPYQLDKINP